MEFKNIDTFQLTLDASVQKICATERGGVKIRLKNPNAAAGNKMYIGPATNQAGAALSATTGYTLDPLESIELDFCPDNETAGRELSVKGTNLDKLNVLVLHP